MFNFKKIFLENEKNIFTLPIKITYFILSIIVFYGIFVFVDNKVNVLIDINYFNYLYYVVFSFLLVLIINEFKVLKKWSSLILYTLFYLMISIILNVIGFNIILFAILNTFIFFNYFAYLGSIKALLVYGEQEEYFFTIHNKLVFFILANIIFYTISITAHKNLGDNYLIFACYLLLSFGILLILNQFKKNRNWIAFIIYTFIYLVIAIGFNFIEFDIVFLTIINLFLFVTIKSFYWIVPHNNYEKMINIMDYIITDDFDYSLSYHSYDIPFKRTNSKHRYIDDELFVLKKYNDMIMFKNKISSENFEEYKNKKMQFEIPKSILLIVYKTILMYCKTGYSTVETPNISFKIEDSSQSLNQKNGKYIVEFKVDLKNLKSIKESDKNENTNFFGKKEFNNKNSNKNLNIKDGIDEIYSICKQNKFNLRIRQGVKYTNYIIRISFELKKKDDDDITMALNKINEKALEDFNDANQLNKSSGLTTRYSETDLQTVETIDDNLRFK